MLILGHQQITPVLGRESKRRDRREKTAWEAASSSAEQCCGPSRGGEGEGSQIESKASQQAGANSLHMMLP